MLFTLDLEFGCDHRYSESGRVTLGGSGAFNSSQSDPSKPPYRRLEQAEPVVVLDSVVSCDTALFSMTTMKDSQQVDTVVKPGVMLRIKLGGDVFETLSNNLDYQSYVDRLREIYPSWDDAKNMVFYSFPYQNPDNKFRMLGIKSWEAMWWRIHKTGIEEVDMEIKQTTATANTQSSTTAPPAYTEKF